MLSQREVGTLSTQEGGEGGRVRRSTLDEVDAL